MPLTLRESICRATRLPRSDDVLMGRAELLSTSDRDLVEAVLIHGQSTGSVARMMSTSPRRIRSRVSRIGQRLTSGRFLNAARSLPYLSQEDARLARLHFCEGLSHRQLCRDLGLTMHTVRRRLDRISAQIAVLSRRPKHAMSYQPLEDR